MRLTEGENHLISERDGLAFCQVWTRPDLSSDEGAKQAGQMVSYLAEVVLRVGTPFRGLIFDVRRGPPVFGPVTRTALAGLFTISVARKVRVAILTSESASQVLQFRSLCSVAPTMTQVFANEPSAVQWLTSAARKP
jgi:hypothetical protein